MFTVLPLTLTGHADNTTSVDLRRAGALAQAQVVLQVDGVEGDIALSPDSRYLAVRVLKGGLRLYDLASDPPQQKLLDDRGQISAVFSADSSTVWLGTQAGKVWQVTLSDGRMTGPIRLAKRRHLDTLVLSPDGQYLGWYDRVAEITGFFDLKTKQQIASWEGVGSQWREVGTPLTFTPDGTRIVFYVVRRDQLLMEHGLALWNLETKDREALLHIYFPKQTRGFAFARGGLYYGTRIDGPYQLRRWDLQTGKETVIDPEARSGHFIDLLASPSGRWLAEGDFEDDGIRVYDLGQDNRAVTIGRRDHVPVGWDAPTEWLFVSNGGVSVWDPSTGEKLAIINAVSNNFRVTHVESSKDGSLLVARWWDVTQESGTPIRYYLGVLRVRPLGVRRNA
jgi:WD40 repeat protein